MTAATAAVPFVDGAAVALFGDAAVVAEVGDNRRARALAAVVERQVAGAGDPPAVIARPRGSGRSSPATRRCWSSSTRVAGTPTSGGVG